MKYRPEIDGLRAVAVWGVVLFHLGVQWMPGGALGVDVFFVISGYLITGILLKDIHRHEFSLAHFYERRARRILPALVPVLLLCCIAAYRILDKYTFHLFGGSVSYLSIFGSNFYFNHITQGYFAEDAQRLPLLHTWSLSVEEQFYVVYPLLVWYLNKRFAAQLKWILLILFLASLAAYCFVSQTDFSAAFYNSLFRCWQLLAGGLLAVQVFPPTENKVVSSVVAAMGWLSMAVCFIFFQPGSQHTFLFSILAVAGAMCILFSSEQEHRRLLAPLRSKTAVFFGKISYSLYLWHWPIIVFASIVSLEPLSDRVKWMAAVVAVLLSFLSYKYIEQPFRIKNGIIKKQKTVLISAVMVLLVAGMAGIFMSGCNHLSNRSRADRMQAEAEADITWMKMGEYQQRFENAKDTMPVFSIGDTTKTVGFILWGDSHARALASGIDSLNNVSGSRNRHGYVFAYPGVAPLLGVEVKKGGPEINQRVFTFIQQHPAITTIILDARWRAYFTRSRDTCKVTDPSLLSADTNHHDRIPGKEIFKTSLRYTVDQLRKIGKRIIIITSTPEVPHNFISLINHARFYNDNLNAFGGTVQDFEKSNGELNTFINSLASPEIKIVAAHRALLHAGKYMIEQQGHLLYRDYNHLSRFGAFEVAKQLQQLLP